MPITFAETVQQTIELLKRAEAAEMALAEEKKKNAELEKELEAARGKKTNVAPKT